MSILLDSGLHYNLRAAAGDANVTVVRNPNPNSTTWCYFRVSNDAFTFPGDPERFIDIPYDPTTLSGNAEADLRSLCEQVAMAAHLITP